MTLQLIFNKIKYTIVLVGMSLAFNCAYAATNSDQLIKAGKQQNLSGAASQKKVDSVSAKTDKVISKFHQKRKSVEQLRVFNNRLKRTIKAQDVARLKLETSIEEASLIERQIVPLMLKMINRLEQFIAQDLPFQLQERKSRIVRIKSYLTNANISASERFRQVLEAYSIEANYGTSVAVSTDILPDNTSGYFLQVGRTGLYFQTLDGETSKVWDKANKQWEDLGSEHNAGIHKSIRIVQGKESKDLMELPIDAPTAL